MRQRLLNTDEGFAGLDAVTRHRVSGHENEKIRNFAGLAIGKPLAHDD